MNLCIIGIFVTCAMLSTEGKYHRKYEEVTCQVEYHGKYGEVTCQVEYHRKYGEVTCQVDIIESMERSHVR